MICAVIHHMQKHLPQDEVFVFFRFFYRLIEQHIVTQLGKIVAHGLFNLVPVHTDTFSISKVCGIKIFSGFNASQSAEPYIITADEMKDLILNRPARVVHMLRELFMG